jgi:hypothetical protein
MIGQIVNGKLRKIRSDNFTGPFLDGAEVVWLPDKYVSLLNETPFTGVYPDDPRLTMSQAELDQVNEVNSDRVQKVSDIQNNLPSWTQVETYLDNLANLAEAKIALKKIARVVYWLAKNTSK